MPTQEGFDRKWGTKQEKEFLDGLGSYSSAGWKHSRAELLRGYLRGLKKRVVWQRMLPGGYVLNLNPAEVEEYAVNLLKEAEK